MLAPQTPPNTTGPNSSRDMMPQLQDNSNKAGGATKASHKTTLLSEQVSDCSPKLIKEL